MYRFLACTLLLHIAAGYWGHQDHGGGCGHNHHGGGGWHHPWHHHNEISDFERLAQCVRAAEQILQNSCSQRSYNRTSEFRGADFYALKYSLPEFPQDNVAVQIKNNVVSVKVSHPSLPEFKDLRILPRFVNVNNANWYFEQGVLTVLFTYMSPYKTDVALTCDKTDDTIIEVPKQADGILRFGSY